MNDPDKFWFGNDYYDKCPTPETDDLLCDNHFPQETIAGRVFGVDQLDTTSIDIYIDVRFTAYPGKKKYITESCSSSNSTV